MPLLPVVAVVALCAAVSGCDDQAPQDAEGQAVVYGTASLYGGGPASGALIDGVVSRGDPCGSDFGTVPFRAVADSVGAYRIHLRILTRDPFRGCIEVVGQDTALELISDRVTEERVYFNIVEPFDSVRMDVILR